MKRSGWGLTLIGAITGVIGLVIAFSPISGQKDSIRQNMNVGSAGVAGMSYNGPISITVNPIKPESPVFKQPQSLPSEIDYRDLASPASSRSFIGKTVLFRALYLSEWNLPLAYKMAGVPVDDLLFINHRSVYYGSSMSVLGSTDSEYPPFPVSVSSKQSDVVRKMKHGDFILIHGIVE